jgi:transcriptional regulator with XRE-family HTH domain
MGEQVADYHHRVAEMLKTVRSYLRITQEQLAEAGGTSAATISRYETGKAVDVQATILVRIAESLALPENVLVDPPADQDEVMEHIVQYRARQRAARVQH